MQVCIHRRFHLIWLSTWSTIPGLSGKVSLCCKTISCLSKGFWQLVFPPANGKNFVVLPSPSNSVQLAFGHYSYRCAVVRLCADLQSSNGWCWAFYILYLLLFGCLSELLGFFVLFEIKLFSYCWVLRILCVFRYNSFVRCFAKTFLPVYVCSISYRAGFQC